MTTFKCVVYTFSSLCIQVRRYAKVGFLHDDIVTQKPFEMSVEKMC